MNLYSITDIKSLLEKHGFEFQKKFGQNFLINEGVPKKIATLSRGAYSGEKKAACIEIGPGIGSLTKQLSQVYDKVLCFEIDEHLVPIWEESLPNSENVEFILMDILKVDLKGIITDKLNDYSVSVCANLPYYITSEVIMKLLETKIPFESITVMVQKEAASRLAAKPNTPEYGSITAAVSYYAEVKKLFDVAPSNFIPRPKVNSTVIRLTPHKVPPVTPLDEKLFFNVLHGAFAQRRKTLLNSLSSIIGSDYDKTIISEAIENSGFDPTIRGEALSIHDYALISNKLLKLKI